jgi:hypothetical protein
VAKIAGEEWKNMTEKQRGPYEEVYTWHNLPFLAGSSIILLGVVS